MHQLIDNLLQEIERQRSQCEDVHTRAQPASTDTDAKEDFGSEHWSYVQKLACLSNDLVEASKLSADPDWHNMKIRDAELLWKIPSRCSADFQFHPPEQLREQCRTIQNARDLRGLPESNTDSIWNDAQLQQWASAEESSLLLVESKGTANKRVERFGLQMVDYLEEKGHSPVYFPNTIKLDGSVPERQLDAPGLLRQVTTQALQKIQLTYTTELLAHLVEDFQSSTTSQAWIKTLGRASQYTRNQLFLVVDLGALRGEVSETQLWPSLFLSLFDNLKTEGHPMLLKFILLNYRHASLLSVSDQLRYHLIRAKPQGALPPDMMKKMMQKQRRDEEMNRRSGKTARPMLYEPENHDEPPKSIEHEPLPAEATSPKEIFTPPKPVESEPLPTQAKGSEEPSLPLTRDKIRVVIICALTLEADAVESLFDRHWDDEGLPFERPSGDTNAYSVGAIGNHNVLLLHMPGMGKVEAARAAATCRASFPKIRLALLVGICGGVPFVKGEEIILGDVVIGDGIVQYDFGRQLPGNFSRKNTLTDNLGRPNLEIRGLVSKLKGLRGRELLSRQMAGDLKLLQRKPFICASYPGCARDVLYEQTYHHAGEGTCEQVGCDGPLVSRTRLKGSEPGPVVHFGLLASGDKVIKSAEDRDTIAMAEGVIGFEMEGAGIWDTFPCVVIKGVCDYADSHKSKRWQRYAAATAATCMKGFLKNVSLHES